MVYIRRVKDEVYEKYLAHGKGEKVEVIFRHDRLTSEGYVKVEWKSKDCPQKSLIRIFENKIANAPEAMDEANRFARLFFGMVSEYNRFETTRLDTARFSFNECFVRLMRLLKEAESFEELVAVLVGAFIAQKYGDLETFVQHAYRGTWFLSATILGAYGQRDSLDAQLLQSYEKFFKTYLEKVAIRCQKKFSEGLFIGKEKHGRKI